MSLEFICDPLPPINFGEWHIPVVLAVDKSGSMSGAPIAELNQGLIDFGNALQQDSLALGRAEVIVISFDSSVHTEVGFRPASEYEAPHLESGGGTSLNEAIEVALDEIEARKALYRKSGINYFRPWLFVLTDGAPTDTSRESATMLRLQQAIENKKVVYIPMGIGEYADIAKLQQYYPASEEMKPVLKADIASFKKTFVWLSTSISVVSQSDPALKEQVPLPPVPSGTTILTVGT